MIDFVTLDDLDGNFWEQNPELKYIEPFAEFYKKKNSSQIMKAIYLAYDFKSKFNRAGIPEEEAKKDIAKNFLKDQKFVWAEYKELIDAYKDKCKTKVQKALELFEEDVVGFQNYLRRLSWEDEEEASVKSNIYKIADEYYKKYKDCEALVKDEIREKRFKGGYRLSPAEKMSTKIDA
jgi:hypothetical protein